MMPFFAASEMAVSQTVAAVITTTDKQCTRKLSTALAATAARSMHRARTEQHGLLTWVGAGRAAVNVATPGAGSVGEANHTARDAVAHSTTRAEQHLTVVAEVERSERAASSIALHLQQRQTPTHKRAVRRQTA